jgi:beta-galactosidase
MKFDITMKARITGGFLLASLLLTAGAHGQNVRKLINLDEDWKFHLGHARDPEKNFKYGGHGAVDAKLSNDGLLKPYAAILTAGFDDREWRTLRLPHDWAVELPFVKPAAHELFYAFHGYKPIGLHYPENSVGWYRKRLSLPPEDAHKRHVLQFDGVYRDCKVFVNGDCVGENKSGYSGCAFDISNYLYFDKPNMVVVKVDATQYEGWWYEGAGIYRHVRLIQTDGIHIPVNGTYVRSDIENGNATIRLETTIDNKSFATAECELQANLINHEGATVATFNAIQVSLPRSGEMQIQQQVKVPHPHLWSLEDPYLHKIVSIIKKDGRELDRYTTRFGIRKVEARPDGLFINGKYVKVKGFSSHQDHAGVGIAVPDAIHYQRIQWIKEMGGNGYRCHHANSPALLDACDELGVLILAETRQFGTSPAALEEWKALITRDRNHPSVFMWCVGNEENVVQQTDRGRMIAQEMVEVQRKLDPSRTVTHGDNSGDSHEGISTVIPVRGFNYNGDYAKYKKEHPEQPQIGTEMPNAPPTGYNYFLADDVNLNTENRPTAEMWWQVVDKCDWFMGGFAWTAFDYRGEAEWPCVVSHFGAMDLCGFPKNRYYYYQSWWSDQDVLHVFPHWNWRGREGQKVKIGCYSNADTVELFLNGTSLGKKVMAHNSHLEWIAEYQPGVLKAIAFRNGRKMEEVVETTDAPYQIVGTPLRTSITADGQDALIVNFTVKDRDGREVPDASNLIRFKLTGDGSILGIGTGDMQSLEDERCLSGDYKKKLFNGKCQLVVQAGKSAGNIEIEATGDGLQKVVCVIAQQ